MGRAKAGNGPGYHRAPLRMPAGYQVNADTEAVEGLAAELRDFVSNSAARQSRDEGHSSTSSPGDRHHNLTPVQVRLKRKGVHPGVCALLSRGIELTVEDSSNELSCFQFPMRLFRANDIVRFSLAEPRLILCSEVMTEMMMMMTMMRLRARCCVPNMSVRCKNAKICNSLFCCEPRNELHSVDSGPTDSPPTVMMTKAYSLRFKIVG